MWERRRRDSIAAALERAVEEVDRPLRRGGAVLAACEEGDRAAPRGEPVTLVRG